MKGILNKINNAVNKNIFTTEDIVFKIDKKLKSECHSNGKKITAGHLKLISYLQFKLIEAPKQGFDYVLLNIEMMHKASGLSYSLLHKLLSNELKDFFEILYSKQKRNITNHKGQFIRYSYEIRLKQDSDNQIVSSLKEAIDNSNYYRRGNSYESYYSFLNNHINTITGKKLTRTIQLVASQLISLTINQDYNTFYIESDKLIDILTSEHHKQKANSCRNYLNAISDLFVITRLSRKEIDKLDLFKDKYKAKVVKIEMTDACKELIQFKRNSVKRRTESNWRVVKSQNLKDLEFSPIAINVMSNVYDTLLKEDSYVTDRASLIKKHNLHNVYNCNRLLHELKQAFEFYFDSETNQIRLKRDVRVPLNWGVNNSQNFLKTDSNSLSENEKTQKNDKSLDIFIDNKNRIYTSDERNCGKDPGRGESASQDCNQDVKKSLNDTEKIKEPCNRFRSMLEILGNAYQLE